MRRACSLPPTCRPSTDRASHDPRRRVSVTVGSPAGLLYVDKPVGLSSHDVVAIVRRAARSKRVGHAGTLDPFATGLLVIAIGPCTRLLPYVVGEPKVYETTIRFGAETDTDDRTGQTTRQVAPPPSAWLADPESVERRAAEATLTGHIAQVPPAFSAKHVEGQRAYDLARQGREVTLPPVSVQVHRWDWLAATADSLSVRITCGGGTYIRALARDLGRLLGSAAHCEALRRVASGPAHVSDAIALDALLPGAIADGTVALRAPLAALGDVAHQPLDDEQRAHLRHGRALRATVPGLRAALIEDEQVVAIAERTADDRWQPRVVLIGAAS
jgi:tRNA pseudouridine55 synthase